MQRRCQARGNVLWAALLCLGCRLLLPAGASSLGAAGGVAAQPHRRFEYKYSFKGPHLVQADGSVPFWVHTGNAIPSADQIRITPSLKSQRGSVWTKTKSIFEYWEVEVTFRVTGRGRIGADGLAIWFTEGQGLEGPVFGAADTWNGVGIFFDSFDNDGKKNNPSIIVVGNNGKLLYDHQNDGSTQALASCQRDFRNKPYPVRAKIIYYEKTLTVMINNGFTPDKEDYEFCAKVENMILPSQGYFGISAATGGLAADDFYETVSDRELRQIFEGQNRIHLEIKQLNRQLDMILDEQRRYVSAVTEEIAKRGAGIPGQQGQVSQQELDTIVKTQEEVLRQVNEMRNSMGDTLRLVSGVQHPGSAGGLYETTQHFNDIKEHLHIVKRDIEHLVQRNMPSNEKPKCPELPPFPSCLSTTHFFIFVAVQTVLFIGYIMYRMERDAAFAQKKAERACLRVHLREKYRLPKSEMDENQIQMAGDDVDLPEDLQKMVAEDQVEEEDKESILGQLQNIQNMDIDTIKEKAQATFTEIKQAAEQKCCVM
ncbi:Protein ERGIC-53 [Chelonia mydas]|uniref:Protein ERGIC-53 n=2 Tax=Durocryptodira TaxID=1579337 RepID=M7BER8_CHEMY|nr:Protein ERGIC-53 [Chelonia mydas]